MTLNMQKFVQKGTATVWLLFSCTTVQLCATHPIVLTLQDAIKATLENNFDIKIKNIDPLIANEAILASTGEFDPNAFAALDYEDIQRRQNSLEFTSTGSVQRFFEEENIRFSSGIRGKVPLGTIYEFSFSINELDNTLNRTAPSATALFNPEYNSFIGLTLTQPLLKNFGTDINNTGKKIANVELEIAEDEREILMTNKLAELINTYYDLLFGQENIRVKQEAVSSAKTLQKENQIRMDAGKMTEIDVAQAELSVSEAEEAVIIAQDFVNERQIALRKLIYQKIAPENESQEIQVQGDFALPPVNYEAKNLRELAYQKRPDVRLTQKAIERGELRTAYAQNQTLPDLNLRMSYGLATLDDSMRNSVEFLSSSGEPQFSTGIALSFPLGNNQAKAEKNAAQLQHEQALLQLQNLKMQIDLDIKGAIQRIHTLQQRLNTAEKSAELAEKALKRGMDLLESGRIRSYAVLELQDDLSEADSRLLAAKLDIKKAESELWLLTGQIWEKHGFSVTRVVDHDDIGKSHQNEPSLIRWRWEEEGDDEPLLRWRWNQ